MGKGTIISEIGNGLYSIEINYGGRAAFNARIASLETKISGYDILIVNLEADLAALLAAEPVDMDAIEAKYLEIDIAKMQRLSAVKEKEYLIDKFPDDRQIEAWCADFSSELTGEVGTIETPGEEVEINIQPGYDGNAVYDGARDGILTPAVAQGPDQSLINMIILPGWQKFAPTYRMAKIVPGTIDYENDTCAIVILPAFSSQQNLDINQSEASSIQIKYAEANPPAGWVDFKNNYSTHPLVTNIEIATEPLSVSPALRSAIRLINYNVNIEHEYLEDASQYRTGQYWQVMGPGDKGDCEDYALTKATQIIETLGVHPKYCQIATCWETQITGGKHAVLQIPTLQYGDLILDNRYTSMIPKDYLKGVYKWDTFYLNAEKWAHFGRYYGDIPIEYMYCNAAAFQDDDLVMVKFEGQQWENQKVVGFYSDPRSCFVMFEISGRGATSLGQLIYFNPFSASYSDGPVKSGGQVNFAGLTNGVAGYACLGRFSEDQILLRTVLKYNSSLEIYSFMRDASVTKRAWTHGVVMDDGKGYVDGGFAGWGEPYHHDYSGDLDAYTFDTDSWSGKQGDRERCRGAWAKLSNYAHSVDGFPEGGHRRYNPISNSWESKQDLGGWFYYLDAFTVDEILYAGLGAYNDVLGYGTRTEPFYGDQAPYPENPDYHADFSYAYNAIGDSWSRIANFPVGRCWPMGSLGVYQSKGYKFGGALSFPYGYSYTPETDVWTKHDDPEASRNMGGSFMAVI